MECKIEPNSIFQKVWGSNAVYTKDETELLYITEHGYGFLCVNRKD